MQNRTDVYIDDEGYFRFNGMIDAATFRNAANRIKRVDGPALLFDLYFGGSVDLSRADMAGVVADVWSAAEYPQDSLEDDTWVRFFVENGYCHDGVAAQRSTEPVTVYRGCPADLRFRMSWTSNLRIARQFAEGGLRGRPHGQVFVHRAEPCELLAFIDGGWSVGRREEEYVIDPSYLDDANVTHLRVPHPDPVRLEAAPIGQ